MSMNPEKIKAVKAMAMLSNKQQLQSFLGAINYYRMFIPKLSGLAEPLYKPLQKNIKFI